jgi:hypothetical protein
MYNACIFHSKIPFLNYVLIRKPSLVLLNPTSLSKPSPFGVPFIYGCSLPWYLVLRRFTTISEDIGGNHEGNLKFYVTELNYGQENHHFEVMVSE